MKARKGNKEYTITEESKSSYQKRGFDIFDEEGTLIQSGAGKTVSLEEYNKLKDELEVAKESGSEEELTKAKEEIKKLKDEVKALKAAAKE